MKKTLIIALVPVMVSTSAFAWGGDKDDDHHRKRGDYFFKNLTVSQKNDIFKKVDTNNDGKLTFKEFENAKQHMMFVVKDKNKDGSLSIDELFTAR